VLQSVSSYIILGGTTQLNALVTSVWPKVVWTLQSLGLVITWITYSQRTDVLKMCRKVNANSTMDCSDSN